MAEEFLSNFQCGSIPPNDGSGIRFSDDSDQPNRLRIILMGSAESVRGMIHRFHAEGIADVGDWSRIIPVPNSTEFMSILVLQRSH